MEGAHNRDGIFNGGQASGQGTAEGQIAARRSRAKLVELGERIRGIRKRKVYSLEAMSQLSGVSKSMISKIERGEATPSTAVLARIAEALGATFSELMASEQDSEVIILPSRNQPVLLDPANGLKRRCLAPILPARGIDWVMNILPPGASTGEFVPHRRGVEEYIHVLEGGLQAILGEAAHELKEGDALYFQAHIPHEFKNVSASPCTYYLIINSQKAR